MAPEELPEALDRAQIPGPILEVVERLRQRGFQAFLVGGCVRDLLRGRTPQDFDIAMAQISVTPEREAEEDASFIQDDMIDLDPALRDAVVLDLPFTPLCRDDCLGLCVTCGANLNDDPDHSHGEEIDARWAALIELDVDGEQN